VIVIHLAPAADVLRPLLDPARGSLSHTDGLAAVAVSDGGVTGVDVERIRPLRHMDRIAARLGIDLPDGPDEARLQAFFAGWVRAEAQGKALREGLSAPAAAREAVWCVPLEGLPQGYAGAVACVDGAREVGVVEAPSTPLPP
jgi:hypothetical protein